MSHFAYARTGAGADIATAATAESSRFRTAISCNDGPPLLCQLARALLKQPADRSWCLTLYELVREEDGSMTGMCYMGYCMEQLEGCTEEARWFFERDIECNDCNVARYALAESLSEAEDAKKDYGRAVMLYEEVMERGGFNLVARKLGGLLDMRGGSGQRVVQMYEWAIENGQSCDAMYLLGRLLIEGRPDVCRDLSRGVSLLERAIEEGENVNAMNSLALLLQGGQGIEGDTKRARELLERAVEGGNVCAMNNLALMVESEEGRRAMGLYEMAADRGNDMAKRNLGRLLLRGAEGVEVDKDRALLLFEGLKEDLWRSVRFDVAVLVSGKEGGSSRAQAIYEEILTEESNVAAMFNLAAILAESGDAERAKELYERAIEEGEDLLSMINLGLLLVERGERGEGVKWLERAIEEGKTEAKYYLARVLGGFDGGARDVKRAVQLFEECINEMQHIGAMNGLAVLLDKGEGVERDVQRAVELSELGVAVGLGGEGLEELEITEVELQTGEESVRIREHEVAIGAHIVSMLNLAELLLSGKVYRDVERACKLCERGLAGKEAQELCKYIELDDLLGEVEGILRVGMGEKEAVRICELAVSATVFNEKSCGYALRVLGGLVLEGKGTKRDLRRATELYEKAAEKGDATAAFFWGDVLAYGEYGVVCDERRAFDMYARAVQIGGGDVVGEALPKMALTASRIARPVQPLSDDNLNDIKNVPHRSGPFSFVARCASISRAAWRKVWAAVL